MKKIVALLLVSVLLITVAACGGGGGGGGTTDGGTTTTQTTTGTTTTDTGTATPADTGRTTVFEPATYTVYVGDSLNTTTTQWHDTEVGRLVQEITGITLDIEYIIGADSSERAALIIATGDYRDIILGHNEWRVFQDAGAYVRLDDPNNNIFDRYATNTKNWWGSSIELLRDRVDGGMWGLAAVSFGEAPQVNGQPFAAFFMKHTAVAMNNYRTIVDPDEYFNVIRQYVAANPETGGQPTIGFSGPAESWRYVFSLLMAERIYGFPNTGRRLYHPQEDFRSYDRNTQVYRYNYLLRLWEMNQEGLLDPQYFSQTHDEYVAKIAAGRVVGFGDERWQIGDAFTLIKNEQRVDDVYIPFALLSPNRVPGMNCPYAGIKGLPIRLTIAISVNAADPAGILQYLDFLASPEMLDLNFWGIEGVHYQRDASGRRHLTQEQYDERSAVDFTDTTGIGHFGGAVPRPLNLGEEKADGSGVWDPNHDPIRSQFLLDDMEKGILANLGWLNWASSAGDQWESPFGFGWEMQISADDDFLLDIDDLYSSELGGENCPAWTQGMVLAGSRVEFDALWDDLQMQFERLNIQALTDHFTNEARARVADFYAGR
jgi:putative aldouronate transport system substrate-binding protein